MAQVEALIKEYHLSKEKCHQQISDIDIDEISRSYCGKWRSLPSHLEMATIDADDVDRGPGNEEEKRRNFLLKWKHTKGSAATYVKLISALHEIRCRNDAEGVSKLIPSTPSTKIPAGMRLSKGGPSDGKEMCVYFKPCVCASQKGPNPARVSSLTVKPQYRTS